MTTPVPLEEEEGGQIEELLQVEAFPIVWVHFYLTQVPFMPALVHECYHCHSTCSFHIATNRKHVMIKTSLTNIALMLQVYESI